MANAKATGGLLGAILAACAVCAPLVVQQEGWVLTVGPDPIGIATGCAGVTKGVKPGQKLTQGQCEQMTAAALVEHGAAIAQCLPAELPTDTRAAFTSFSYNVGVAAFCRSGVARKAVAGDLRGACAELDRWIYAGGKPLPGLVKRRAAERQLCERGLA